MHEIETKILGVDVELVAERLESLGARKIQDTRLKVDWYGPKGLTHKGDDQWYLRVREYSDGKAEVTWKGKSDILGAARRHKEINFTVDLAEQAGHLFEALDLELYAHQEKNRISWEYKNWRFDADLYPGMPWYLEIEGESEEHIREAVALLGLEGHTASSEGEHGLIFNTYKLNWFDMRF